MYYTNFVQVKYYNMDFGTWRKGLVFHDWLLDYEGFAINLDSLCERYKNASLDIDEHLIELSWKNLTEIE